jgi:hypothetical protein
MDNFKSLWRKGSCIGIDYLDPNDGAFTFNVSLDEDAERVFDQLKSLVETGYANHGLPNRGEEDSE